MDLEITAKSVTIDPDTYKGITVRVEYVDKHQVINHFSPSEIVEEMEDKDLLLDEIGIDYIKEYFGLTEEVQDGI